MKGAAGQGDIKAGEEEEGYKVRGWTSHDPSQHSAFPAPLCKVILRSGPAPGRVAVAVFSCR